MSLKKKINFKVLSCFLTVFVILAQVNMQSVLALQSNGSQNKIANIDGYRIIANNKIEILTDKPPVAPDPSGAQFKLFEGTSTTGQAIAITSAASNQNGGSTDTPNTTMTAAIGSSGLHMSTGGSYTLTAAANFNPGTTYTIVMSNTIVGGTGFTLGHTNSNKDVSFTFTCPDTLASGSNANSSYNSSVIPTVSFMPGNNANNVSLEGNVWFNVSVPVAHYDDVLKGLVLKRNGNPVTYAPFTLPSSTTSGALTYDCYAPVYNDDHTFFGFLLTQGTSSYYDFNWQPNSTYELDIPEIDTINGQKIPAQTMTFNTMNGDTPNKLTGNPAVTAAVSGNNVQIGWNAVVAGPLPQSGESGNLGWPAADGYNVYVSTNPYWNFVKLNSSPIPQPSNSTSATPVSYTTSTSGLLPNTTYYVRVSPLDNGYEGGMYCGSSTTGGVPTTVSFVTPAATTAAPAATTVAVSGPASVSIPTNSTTASYTATVKDQNSNTMTGENVTWSLQTPVTGVNIDSTTGVVTINNTTTAASFTVVAADGSVTGSETVSLTAAVSGVTLNKTSDTLTAGGTDQLTDTIAPVNATNQSVTWASDNTAVATVSNTGLVTAVGTGSANITVTTADGGKTATCAVTVQASATAAPTFVSAVATSSSCVQVKFSKQMAAVSTTTSAGFTVIVNGVVDPIQTVALNSADATIINLNLNIYNGGKAITYGQVVTVAYTAGTVAAADTTTLGSFTAQPVKNMISPPFAYATTDITGTKVTVSFNAIMSAVTTSAGFTITADGSTVPISAVTPDVKPTKIDFSLSTPINFGQILSIAYDSTKGTVTDANLVPLATRGAQVVFNMALPTAPAVSSTATSGPTHIILTMNSPLRGTTGDPAAFTVAGAASNPKVTAVTVSGSKVILTLNAAIANGETITVNYTKTGINNLINGTEAASFSGRAVTNNIAAAATAPTFVSAASNLTGNVLTVVFNKAMAALSTTSAGFTVSVDGADDAVTAVALNSDPTKIDLALTRPVLKGQTVTLTYKAGTITADDGGLLAAFNAQPVSNNTLAYNYVATVAGSYYTSTAGYAGNGISAVDSTVKLNSPNGIAIDSAGNIYIADTSNYRIREVAAITHSQFGINMTAGNIYTVAGNGTRGSLGDGNIATSAQLYNPSGVAVDSAGNLYITDYGRVRKVDVNGVISVFAGNACSYTGYSGDGGLATNALINGTNDVTVDSVGNIYIVDPRDYVIRKVDTSGIITTVAGNGTSGFSGVGGPATSAMLKSPCSVKVDKAGNIYFTDSGNNVAMEVAATTHSQFGINMTAGYIYTIAGNGTAGDTGNGGAATSAEVDTPNGIAIDSVGNIFIVERGSNYVRKVDVNGIISSVTGMGVRQMGYSGENIPALSNEVDNPSRLAVDGTDNLYFADSSNQIIRYVQMAQPVAVTGVTLDQSSKTLNAGDTLQLTATVAPYNATNKDVTWSSSDTTVATVDNTGKVTAVAAGTATITATTADGNKTAQCTVTVNQVIVNVTGVTLDQSSKTLNAGDTLQLTAAVAPANATNKNVTWSSSNTAAATVDQTGKVTAVAAGTATITAATADGNKTAQCTVTVNSTVNSTANSGSGSSGSSSSSSGSGGGSAVVTTPTASTPVVVPVITKTDSSSNVVATLDASNINNNAVNEIQIQEPKPESKIQVQIPGSAVTNGSASFEIDTNSIKLDIPAGVIDSSSLGSGATLQVSKNVVPAADANALLANVPQGNKSIGKVFTLNMAVCDSSNNVVKDIHNFASGKSVAVTIKLSSDDIKGMDTSKISAFYFDTASKSWVDIGGSFDEKAMTYTFNTTHFTDFTIMEKSAASSNVKRLAGLDRIETSLAIAKEEFADKAPDAVVLTTANGFPDALSGEGLAYKYNAPMLLVNKSVNDSKNVLDYITSTLSKDKNIYILGGTGVVSSDISDYLTSQGYNIIRIGGSDRYETNQKVVDNLNVAKGTSIVLASGNDFADALSVSSIAALKGYPVLLSGKDNLSANAIKDITNIQPTNVYIIGGTGALSADIEAQIKNINGNINIVRLGGNDRYETSMKIVDYFNLNTDTISVASGRDFPDALSGALLAAKKNSSILLINNTDITRQKDLLNKHGIKSVIVFGGEGVISSDTANSLIQK